MTGPAVPSYLELGVPDSDRARRFYAAVLGWPEPDPALREVSTSGLSIGIHGGDDNRHFEVFFTVADLDDALRVVRSSGGSVVRPVEDAPGFGRFAECQDDQGVAFGLRQLPDRATGG